MLRFLKSRMTPPASPKRNNFRTSLELTTLEPREVPAVFAVSLTCIEQGIKGTSLATHTGSLYLNPAMVSIPDGPGPRIAIVADDALSAAKQALRGRVGVYTGTTRDFYEPIIEETNADNTYTDWSNKTKPFYVMHKAGDEYEVWLEDLFNHPAVSDNDYDDHYWTLKVVNLDQQAPPEQGTVNNQVPYLEMPKMLIYTGQTPLDELKVGKWENAYEQRAVEAGGPELVLVKNNFIDLDPDRFFISILDTHSKDANNQRYGANNKIDTIYTKVTTDSDPLAVGMNPSLGVKLTETGPNTGQFFSEHLLLVADDVDDKYKVDGIHDNATNDRTYKVKLGDKVTFRYDTTAATGFSIHKYMPVRKVKTVDVNITMMTTKKSGDQGANNLEVDAFKQNPWILTTMNRTQQFYAQVGIELRWTIQFADQPKKVINGDFDVDLSNDLDSWDAAAFREINGLLRGKFHGTQTKLRSASNADVDLFFIYRFTEDLIGTEMIRPLGQGFASGHPAVVKNADLHRSAIVATYDPEFGIDTTAHELGHVATDLGHYTNYKKVNGQVVYVNGEPVDNYHFTEPNLMNEYGSTLHDQIEPVPDIQGLYDPEWSQAAKRFYQAQHDVIYNNVALVLDYIPLS
jgi:hypothetical protein